jgi:hypothetical protein
MESSSGAAAEAKRRRKDRLTTIANSMIDAGNIDISQRSQLVKLLDPVDERFLWRASLLLTRIVPSEMAKSLEGTASLLERALRGLGDHEIAIISDHGLTPDDRELVPRRGDQDRDAPAGDASEFEMTANDVADVKRLVDSIRHLCDRSRRATSELDNMIDPKTASARDRMVAARREIVKRLAAVWKDLTGSPFTGFGRSAAFANAFLEGVGLTSVSGKTIENDWARLQQTPAP